MLICVFHALAAGHYANFYPINGTFQNFNPVRCFLTGQVPFKDFQVYLGLGHLYLGSIATLIFGGNYRASLQAFSFLTFGSLALFVFLIAYVIFRKKEFTAAFTNILLVIFLVEPIFYKNSMAGTNEILDALEYALGPGNSARFIRGFILPLAVLLLFGGIAIYRRFLKESKYKEVFMYTWIGIVAGFSLDGVMITVLELGYV